jgi:hypothetical protein
MNTAKEDQPGNACVLVLDRAHESPLLVLLVLEGQYSRPLVEVEGFALAVTDMFQAFALRIYRCTHHLAQTYALHVRLRTSTIHGIGIFLSIRL